MPSSLRLPVVLGIGLFVGLGGVVWSLIDSKPAFGLEASALHSPPTGYQPMGPCAPDLGVPYQHTKQRVDAPILFYYQNELKAMAYLMKERDIQEGQTWTVLNELGGIPIERMSLTYIEQSVLHKRLQLQGPYYQFWMLLEGGGPGADLPC